MSWENPPKGRSFACNGELVRQRRRLRRWTQEDLADVTKLSVRVIAKAEAGGALHADTIEDLATALSMPETPLFPEDLISNPKQLALEFLQQLKSSRGQVVAKCQHFLDENIRFVMPGNPETMTFAGCHRGLAAMDKACAAFFEVLEITKPELWRTEFAVCEGNEVVTGQWLTGQLRGLSEKGIVIAGAALVVNRMVIERGKIVSIDDYYLHLEAEKELAKQRELLHAAG
jgi:transcriptional regulator with XRE-family HTH domain